ncbi:MAG: tetratricopeptide repeat protein [Nitrospirota bacterium]
MDTERGAKACGLPRRLSSGLLKLRKRTMVPRNQKENNAGIYQIRHKPSGVLYVGQATDVRRRWREHKKQLKADNHYNKRLQKLWRSSDENDFEFEIIEKAPIGLSALQLQRWLVKEERRIYVELKRKGMAMNRVGPKIVPTTDAVKEYQKEEEERNRHDDNRISAERREIKKKIEELKRQLEPQSQKLYELRRKYFEQSELIKNSTGWRRLFHGRPPGFNPEEERKKIEMLASEINRILPNVNNVQEEISRLREEYRSLYGQFTKVADQRGFCSWFGLRRSSSKAKIREDSRMEKYYYQVLGLKPNASKEEVEQAYKDLLTQQKAQEKVKEIDEAYKKLILYLSNSHKQTTRIQPDDVDAYYNLGVKYEKVGMYKEAIEAYKRAIMIKPDYAKANYSLGIAYLYSGQKGKALEQYEELKKIDKTLAEELFTQIYR